MTKANDTNLTPNEVVSTLRNSSLPTLIVEGRSDMVLYQAIEEMCFVNSIDIMPVGSRTILFEVHRRRAEFSKTPVAFLADSDMFAFGGIPPEHAGIIFTSGYSIENDILAGGKAFRILSKKHVPLWSNVLGAMTQWFASIVHRYLNGEAVEYKQHPSQIVDFANASFKSAAKSTLLSHAELSTQARTVLDAPTFMLRGHTLLDGFGHFLATVKQKPKCNKDVLLRMDLVSWESNNSIKRLIEEVQKVVTIAPDLN
jgi:hypothetical protein